MTAHRSHRGHAGAVLPVLSVLALSVACGADDRTWINPLGGLFAEPTNWQDGLVPTGADRAVFGLSETFTVTFAGDRLTDRFTVEAGAVTLALGGFEYVLASEVDPSGVVSAALSPVTLTLSDGTVRIEDELLVKVPFHVVDCSLHVLDGAVVSARWVHVFAAQIGTVATLTVAAVPRCGLSARQRRGA